MVCSDAPEDEAMVVHFTTVTRKGQVTVPVDIRRALGLRQGDRIAVEQNGDVVVMRRSESVAEGTAGILAAYRRQPAPSAEDERDAFERAVAEEVVASMERT
jgi:AbrB family looped-hinge helix DNA binding protein